MTPAAQTDHRRPIGVPGTTFRTTAAAAGATAIALAVHQVATPGAPAATYETAGDWLREALTLGYLLASIAAVRLLARHGLAGRVPTGLVVTGYGLIAAGVGAGMVLREDPDWFFLLGGPGNLLAAAGFVALAVAGWRRRVLRARTAALGGIGGLVAVVLAEVGTGVLIGSFWLALALDRDLGGHGARAGGNGPTGQVPAGGGPAASPRR